MVLTRLLSIAVGLACGAVLLAQGPATGRPAGVAVAQEPVSIESPADGATVTGQIEIRGTATVAEPGQLDFFRIYIGNGRTPAAMRPLGAPRDTPVVGGVLASVDSGLLAPGEVLIQLSVFEKGGRQTDVSVVVVVEPGPTPTRVLAGPRIEVPPVALGPPPDLQSPAATNDYPVAAMPDVHIPEFEPIERSLAPIPRIGPNPLYDALPSDPVQVDPVLDGIQIRYP